MMLNSYPDPKTSEAAQTGLDEKKRKRSNLKLDGKKWEGGEGSKGLCGKYAQNTLY